MASAAQSLRLVCRSCRSQRPTQHIGAKVFVAWKSASGGGGAVKESSVKLDDGPKGSAFEDWEVRDKERFEKYRYMEPSSIAKSVFSEDWEDADRKDMNNFGWDKEINDFKMTEEKDKIRELTRPYNRLVKPDRGSFWDEDETDNELITNNDTDEFDEDDMTDIAHAKLEEQREQREYSRIAVWEMPLLASKCNASQARL